MDSRQRDTRIHGDVKHLQLLFVCCCCISIFTATSCSTVEGYSCVTAYWDTVSCVLSITNDPSNTTYRLEFTIIDGPTSLVNRTFLCPLVRMDHSYHTDCKIIDRGTLNSFTEYAIHLCTGSNHCQSLTEKFDPSNHIQLTIPFDVNVQQTPMDFNLSWKSGYETHDYLNVELKYHIFLEASKRNENKPFNRTLHSNHEIHSLSRSSLKPYDTFCVKIRSFANNYHGTWSEWSNRTCWESDEEHEQTPVTVTRVVAPVCVIFAVLLFLFYSPAARMKIKSLSHTPSPAPFFQPLFQQYEGNLQDWLTSQSKCTLIYKTEETLTTDAVTVEPKALKRSLEENLNFHDPVVTLPVPQCQSSYVGLPGMPQASSPVTVVCPADTSYTQLPCSMWGFNPGGIRVEPSPPKDPLEVSCSDSGCSFDSLTESPDCSLPTSPVVDTSPPFHCNDYCILNKTAEGVVPVLVTKGSTSDPHQDEDET